MSWDKIISNREFRPVGSITDVIRKGLEEAILNTIKEKLCPIMPRLESEGGKFEITSDGQDKINIHWEGFSDETSLLIKKL